MEYKLPLMQRLVAIAIKNDPNPSAVRHPANANACASIVNSIKTASKYPNGVLQLNGSLCESQRNKVTFR